MKRLQDLMQQIIVLTTKIETDYPELYEYLDETPIRGREIYVGIRYKIISD